MPITIMAETWKETVERLKGAAASLLPRNPPVFIPEEQKQRGRIAYFFHVLMNVGTELNRRNAQIGSKIILFGFPLLILLVEWQ